MSPKMNPNFIWVILNEEMSPNKNLSASNEPMINVVFPC